MDDASLKLEAFLTRQLPNCVEKVEHITGGFINFCFRIHIKQKLPSVSSDKSNNNTLLASIVQLKPKTLIAKIASDYFAGSEKTIPFSINRQRIEATALKLFNKMHPETDETKLNFTELLSVVNRNKTIRVGNVFWWSKEDHILIMDDFGPVQTMAKWLISEQTKSSSTESMIASARAYGEQIANFLIDMQVSSLPYVEQLDPLFRDIELRKSMSSMLFSTFTKLHNIDNSIDEDEIKAIFSRCFQYNDSRAPTDGKVLAHGDFNAPNILVDEGNSILAILDWEFARINSPALDLCLFLARAHIALVRNPTNELILNLINTFMDTYRESAKKRDVSWYKNEREQYLFAWYLGVMHGFITMQYTIIEPCCQPQNGLCDHKRSLVAIGVDYIRRCRLGPEKITYDSMSHDQFIGRLLQAFDTN
jgi:aminoglycoside/choline kinase family phosphotransferase